MLCVATVCGLLFMTPFSKEQEKKMKVFDLYNLSTGYETRQKAFEF